VESSPFADLCELLFKIWELMVLNGKCQLEPGGATFSGKLERRAKMRLTEAREEREGREVALRGGQSRRRRRPSIWPVVGTGEAITGLAASGGRLFGRADCGLVLGWGKRAGCSQGAWEDVELWGSGEIEDSVELTVLVYLAGG
jgi:hypothetical protein